MFRQAKDKVISTRVAKLMLIVLIPLLLLVTDVLAAKEYTISGHVRDSASGEALIGTSIYIPGIKSGTKTNVYGFYSLTVPAGGYTISYSMMGYATKELQLLLNRDVSRNIELTVIPIALDSIVVTAGIARQNITIPEMGAIRIQPIKMRPIPIIFGEQDVLKVIQLMPGVQQVAEGQSGFSVRGGSPDQNLILLDEATVYNAAHLLGFFSIFNSDAIKAAKLIKGSAPAEYGGRLSSVLDIKMNDGNSKRRMISGGLGLISSRLTVQGPIIKERSSFLLSGRRTYLDLFFKLNKDDDVKNSQLYFYDLNMKVNTSLGPSDRLYLSGYFGRDVLGFKEKFGIDWGNITGTLRWNHIINNKLFLNSSLIFSKYSYAIGISNGDELIDITSSIEDYNLKEDWQYFLNPRHSFKFGLNTVFHVFLPGEIAVSSGESSINPQKMKDKYALESALYLAHEYQVTDQLSASSGIRYTRIDIIGPGDVYTIDDHGMIIDTTSYRVGRRMAYYDCLEPRFTLNYMLNKSSSLKLSYAKNSQYLHLLSATTSATPFDTWLPSTNNIKPGTADQVSVGYFGNFGKNEYELSIEVYHKDLKNQVDYRNGADIYLNELVEAELVFGKAWSSGAELLLKKNSGRYHGWLSYTLSWTMKKFSAINDGTPFPARQDRTHDLALVGIYNWKRGVTLSANWIFATGNAVTFPSGKYQIDEHVANLYSERNGYRMPAYHRLDLGLTIKREHSSWNFSLYNAYGRRNAYAIVFRKNEEDPSKTEAVRYSLFSFVPSITYNFEW